MATKKAGKKAKGLQKSKKLEATKPLFHFDISHKK
jgi:hypothetical protein